MKYLSVAQTAESCGIFLWRILGVISIRSSWSISDDEPKPVDAGMRSRKYIK